MPPGSDREVTVPAIVRAVAAGRPHRPVWRNPAGGVTFEIGDGTDRRFVKWAPPGNRTLLAAEATRLAWAVAFTPVPRVLDHGGDDEGDWLVTAGLPGETAVSPRWMADPATAVAAVGEGLRDLHDGLPVEHCPFSWSAGERVAQARQWAAAGAADPSRWHPEHRDLGLAALDRLADIPSVDRLVVCHGDACAPNTLVDDDGHWCGHVDLAALGVADRWADLAVASWSATWNYGPAFENRLLDAYGAERDDERIRFYRLLWDLCP